MTTENNKLLAEFMGEQWHNNFFKDVFIIRTSNIPYHFDTDWNWLMQVVEKIENLHEDNNVLLFNRGCGIDATSYNISLDCNSKIESVYLCCVDFVKWYNKNN